VACTGAATASVDATPVNGDSCPAIARNVACNETTLPTYTATSSDVNAL
jgi:hypothetical protein